MVILTVLNDGTGTEAVGNYAVRVYMNQRLIAHGGVVGYPRAKGWKRLLQQAIKASQPVQTPDA